MTTQQVTTEKLTASEKATLAKCEEAIAESFLEVGRALTVIRDGRLYREEFKSFEDYCKEKWGWRRQHAYQLISGTQIAEHIASTNEDIPMPTAEFQVRPLSKLDPAAQVEVWEEAVEKAGGNVPTESVVRELVNARITPINPGVVVPEIPAEVEEELEEERTSELFADFIQFAVEALGDARERRAFVRTYIPQDDYAVTRDLITEAAGNLMSLAGAWKR